MTPRKKPSGEVLQTQTLAEIDAGDQDEERFLQSFAPPQGAAEVVRANLQGAPFRPTRVTLPTRGSSEWTVATASGEEKREALVGVVIYNHTTRAYYEGAFVPGANASPTCSSPDGDQGTPGVDAGGKHYEDCRFCPMAEWYDGKPPACKEYENLYLLEPKKALPIIVRLAPASLRPWEQFRSQLTEDLIRIDRAIISIRVDPEGPRAVFRKEGQLTEGDGQSHEAYVQAFIAAAMAGGQRNPTIPVDTTETPDIEPTPDEFTPEGEAVYRIQGLENPPMDGAGDQDDVAARAAAIHEQMDAPHE
jgi:hypothetical protein